MGAFYGNGILAGGSNITNTPYVVLVSSSGVATALSGDAPVLTGSIDVVAINSSGNAIAAGTDNNFIDIYAVLISPAGAASAITGTLPSATGSIDSVAISSSGTAILGGQDDSSPTPYIALVSPAGVASSITGDTPSGNGQINSVAINSSGNAIAGGQDNGSSDPYVALISPAGVAQAVMGLPTGASIRSVAIADSGICAIGGTDGSFNAYAALVSPTGEIIDLSGLAVPTGSGNILSVSIASLLFPVASGIPTDSLTGNNLIFANYINQYAPQDAFYFALAILDGTLSAALESAAPTRNAASLYTANYNLFFLTHGLVSHMGSGCMGGVCRRGHTTLTTAAQVHEQEVLASKKIAQPVKKERPYRIWFDAIGAIASQKAQSQTPAFNPSSGGGIVAFDAEMTPTVRLGAGASYFFTHIHEAGGAGHSHINQETLFTNVSWDSRNVYIDGALWGGWFQTSQVRNIRMTGFSFKAASDPDGWQLLPHLELGARIERENSQFLLNPFAMIDWANAWQQSYQERGAGPFNAAQKAHYSSLLRTEVGLRFNETLSFDAWDLIFQEKASYVNTQSFGVGKVNGFLVGSPGSFALETLASALNLGIAQFMMTFAPLNLWYPMSTISYQGEFGVQYQSHQMDLEFSWNF